LQLRALLIKGLIEAVAGEANCHGYEIIENTV
jgi:hypothetical protein